MIAVCGVGWINEEGYGCVRKSVHYDNPKPFKLPDKNEIFTHPFENFGRLDNISKMTCYAVSLALKDAGLSDSLHKKQDIGIIGTNSCGCVSSDANYFKDYLDNGRTLGRGNLFIYTLPSSPVSEAAIYFGLQGPLFYITRPGSLADLTALATEMISLGEASMMLVGIAEEQMAVFFVLGRDSDFGETICDIESILNRDLSFSEMIKGFSHLNPKDNGRKT